MSSLYRASFIKAPMISNGTFFIRCCANDVFLCKELFESKDLFGQQEFSWWADSCVTSCTSVFIVTILVTYCSVCTVWLFAILLATKTTCLSFFFVKLIPPATIYSAETVALPRDSIEFLVWRRALIGLESKALSMIMCSIVLHTMCTYFDAPFCVPLTEQI